MKHIAESMPNWLRITIVLYAIVQFWLAVQFWGGIIEILSRPFSLIVIIAQIALVWLVLKLLYYLIIRDTPKPTGASAWRIKAIVAFLLINISINSLLSNIITYGISALFLASTVLSTVLAFKIHKKEASQGRIITFKVLTLLLLILNIFYLISGMLQ